MNIMRIFHGGGVPAYQRRDEELANLGYTVVLVVPTWFRELPQVTVAASRNDTISVVPVRLFGVRRNPFFFYNPLQIARLIRLHAPDILDIHEEPYSLAAASILLGSAIARATPKVLFRSSQNVYKRYPWPFSAIQRWVFRRSSAAYVPSQQALVVLKRKGYLNGVTVVGNGVNIPSFTTPPERIDAPLAVLYVGRLIERKGVVELLNAAISLKGAIALTFVGSGPLEEALQEAISTANAGSFVTMKGALSHAEVASFMLDADVICVPSHVLAGWSEQFSRALVEGMAAYCVPVVSDSGALPEVSGSIRPPIPWNQASALEQELEHLSKRDDLHVLKGLAHDRATSAYSWRATSAQIAEIYLEAISHDR